MRVRPSRARDSLSWRDLGNGELIMRLYSHRSCDRVLISETHTALKISKLAVCRIYNISLDPSPLPSKFPNVWPNSSAGHNLLRNWRGGARLEGSKQKFGKTFDDELEEELDDCAGEQVD